MFAKPRGSTIIFVLYVMIVAMIITTTVTTIVLNNLRSTTAIAQQAHSYYAAESINERGLFYAFSQRGQNTTSAAEAAATINAFTQSLANGAAATITAEVNSGYPAYPLPQDETIEFNVYGEDTTDGYQLVPLTGLSAVSINWNESSSCTPGTSQVEVSYSAWTADQWEDISSPLTPQTRYTVTCPSQIAPDGSIVCGPYSLGLDANHLYKVRVKGLGCDIQELFLNASYDMGGPSLFANQIKLNALGKFAATTRSIGVDLPWGVSLNPYADFVLFTEDDINK